MSVGGQNKDFGAALQTLLTGVKLRLRRRLGNPRQSWILESTPWIPDSRNKVPVFVSGTPILDSNR